MPGKRTLIAAIALLVPALAAANSDYGEICAQMLSLELPQTADSIPGLEARQYAQLYLASYYSGIDTPESKALQTRMLDAAFAATLQILDEEQEKKRDPDDRVEDDLVERFMRHVHGHPNEGRYKAMLNDKLQTIHTLHEIAPGVQELVKDLKLPIFESDRYLETLAFRRESAPLSLPGALETAKHLRASLALESSPDGAPASTPDPKIVALDGLAAKISETIMAVPVNDPREVHGVMRYNNHSLSLKFIKQILERNGRHDQAEKLDQWMQQKDAHEAVYMNIPQAKARGESADQVFARQARISRFVEQIAINPAWAANQAWELTQAKGVHPGNAGQYQVQIVNRLRDAGQLDTAVSFANAIQDPMSDYVTQRDLASSLKLAGRKDDAANALYRARSALRNVRHREGSLAAMWRETIDIEIDLQPEQSWSSSLPAAISQLNETFSDPYWEGRSFAEVDRRRSIESILGHPVIHGFNGLFQTLARRDSEGRRQFDAERAMIAASSLADPTLAFGAKVAVCIEIERTRKLNAEPKAPQPAPAPREPARTSGSAEAAF